MSMTQRLLLVVFLVGGIGSSILSGVGVAQQGPEEIPRPTVGDVKAAVTYDGTLYPSQSVAGQNTDMGMSQQRVRLVAPLLQERDKFEWSVSAGVTELSTDGDARLPQSGQVLPDQLWEVRLGTATRWKLDNGWILGGNLGVSSASDEPLASLDETAINAGLTAQVPWRPHFTWLFGLHYSSLGEIAFPLPSAALVYEPGPQFQLAIGMPFTVRWRPTEDLEFSASYGLLRRIHTQASYRLLDSLRLHAGFDWDSQRFFRHDRSDTDASLSYNEKRVSAGIGWNLMPHVSLDASGGYAFDRFWFEGEHYSDRKLNQIELKDGPFVALRLLVRF